jgi:hypothetical protein
MRHVTILGTASIFAIGSAGAQSATPPTESSSNRFALAEPDSNSVQFAALGSPGGTAGLPSATNGISVAIRGRT